jgi:hypothetical protein
MKACPSSPHPYPKFWDKKVRSLPVLHAIVWASFHHQAPVEPIHISYSELMAVRHQKYFIALKSFSRKGFSL